MNKQKFTWGFILVLIVLCGFLVFQWNGAKDSVKHLVNAEDNRFVSILIHFNNKLYFSSETLELYSENFTDKEKILFDEAVRKDRLSLVYYRSYFSDFGTTDELLLFKQYIWRIEKVIGEIADGVIKSEQDIHYISDVIKRYSDILSKMLFGEGSIDGINDEQIESMTKVLQSLISEIEAEVSVSN